jgi:hypothetical protein
VTCSAESSLLRLPLKACPYINAANLNRTHDQIESDVSIAKIVYSGFCGIKAGLSVSCGKDLS